MRVKKRYALLLFVWFFLPAMIMGANILQSDPMIGNLGNFIIDFGVVFVLLPIEALAAIEMYAVLVVSYYVVSAIVIFAIWRRGKNV